MCSANHQLKRWDSVYALHLQGTEDISCASPPRKGSILGVAVMPLGAGKPCLPTHAPRNVHPGGDIITSHALRQTDQMQKRYRREIDGQGPRVPSQASQPPSFPEVSRSRAAASPHSPPPIPAQYPSCATHHTRTSRQTKGDHYWTPRTRRSPRTPVKAGLSHLSQNIY